MKSPILGIVLLAAGIFGSVTGATGGGEVMIAASAIPAVLGMILLIPLVLAGIGKVGGRLPLVLRYAVRDAARHRTRTVPAVAAVAATVAGVVALGVGLTSDQKEAKETYTASLADGFGVVTSYGTEPAWDAYRAAILREAPDATVTEQLGISDNVGTEDGGYAYTEVKAPGTEILLSSYGSSLGSSVLVSDDALPDALVGVSSGDSARAVTALGNGGAVAFYSGDTAPDSTTVKIVQHVSDNTGVETDKRVAELPATFVKVDGLSAGPAAVISSAAAEQLGIEPSLVGLVTGKDDLSKDDQKAVQEALGGVDDMTSLYVERGFQADDETLIAQLILIALGGVLMLGGTLTATFLALSDARPDLATLSAVGASPRTRRGVAAAYAVVVGFVGAVLGAAVGFIPGIAVTYPLTSQNYGSISADGSSEFASGPYLDIPWLMIIGLVVVLPLLTAAVVGLFARSRLPLVARLD
jgi:putative ABC transport system permease protein